MTTTFPMMPPAFNKDDVSGSTKRVCVYLRNLQENLDFTVGQIKKEIDRLSISMNDADDRIKGLQSMIEAVQSSVDALGRDYSSLEARVRALEERSV